MNNIADVFINRRHIGEHRGGYGAFIFEITGKVEYGKENSILVRVNNGEQLDLCLWSVTLIFTEVFIVMYIC